MQITLSQLLLKRDSLIDQAAAAAHHSLHITDLKYINQNKKNILNKHEALMA